MSEPLQSLDQVKATAIDMAIKFGPKLVVAGLILLAGYMVTRWTGAMVGRLLARFKLEAPVRSLLTRVAQIFVFVLFAIMAMQNLGVELLPLVAGLGVAGAGIALALQGILGNVAAGLTIIFTQPFHVGDYISIAHEEGEVLDISLFSTTLGHTDRSKVVIPNRKIVGEILHNYGQIRQLSLSVSITRADDLERALAAIEGAVSASACALKDPAPAIGVSTLAGNTIVIAVAPWVKVPDFPAAGGQINRAIVEKFGAAGIHYPAPPLEIRMPGGAQVTH